MRKCVVVSARCAYSGFTLALSVSAAAFLVFFARFAGARIIAANFWTIAHGARATAATFIVPFAVNFAEQAGFVVGMVLTLDRKAGDEFYRAFAVIGATGFGGQHVQAFPLAGRGPLGDMVAVKFVLRVRGEGLLQIVDALRGKGGIARPHQLFGGLCLGSAGQKGLAAFGKRTARAAMTGGHGLSIRLEQIYSNRF